MARNYVALPFEYLEEFEELTHEEVGRLVCALLHYGATGEERKPEGREGLLWRRVVKQEDRFQESYEATVEARREAARKASAARWSKREMPSDANASSRNAEDAIIETETETKTETEPLPSIEGEVCAPAARFAPPSGEEVASYCREAGLSADPEAFADYYASRGWKVGTVPMTDWRAALRSWARREHTFPSRGSPPAENYTAPTVPTAKDLQTMAQLERLRQKMTAGQGCAQQKTPRDGPGE